MAIPPNTSEYEQEGELELSENCFVFSGVSLEYLKPFRVFELTRGEKELKVKVTEDIGAISQGEELKPGSLHTEGTVKVFFHPAKPGHRYHCDFSGD